ncbi:hypothetical protein EV645_0077 [Kribbella rubisoli]|uniref:Uncharacterized protein n=1 Tax=Kribbella rubisoli TaxID=3075929 RepID=A0A4Q7XMZ5_9ACTN|nr:hypothetical protein [Kribbella rubisoli]RZU24435.1 hypothetical protein EV645_0077 [Kribbella rubisoli]
MAGWEDVREFTLGNISRPATRTGNRIEFGPNAIRAVQDSNDDRVLDPYAYVGANRSLYLDADLTQLLCQVVVTGEHSWSVQDASAAIIGTITRLPPDRRILRPNWRIDQPSRPVITGRTEWLSGSPGRLAAKALSRLIAGVVDGLTGIGDEGGEQPTKSRTLEWRTSGELVMISDSSIRITADWLDRRLAFAYSLLAR